MFYQDIYIRLNSGQKKQQQISRDSILPLSLFNPITIIVGKSSLDMQRASAVLFYLKAEKNLNLNARGSFLSRFSCCCLG